MMTFTGFRELDGQASFKKYDIVFVQARPNRGDPRGESWRPVMTTLRREGHLRDWSHRWPYLADHISDSMCGLLAGVRDHPPARSLAALRLGGAAAQTGGPRRCAYACRVAQQIPG
jgi:hypothetical protein